MTSETINVMVSLKFIVYGLIDPQSGLVRYIGKSSSGMRRPRQHASATSLAFDDYKSRWIRQLISRGLTYEIVILDISSSNETIQAAERRWIAIGRRAGWPLTNLTDGGEGCAGRVLSAKTRAKISEAHLGKKKSSAHRAALAASRRGTTTPLDTRAKQSASAKERAKDPSEHARLATLRTGAVNSDAARAKLRMANLGLKHSDERRAKNAAARLGKPRSKESVEKQRATLRRMWSDRWAHRRAS